jgi:hypothetical protein
VHTVRLTVTFLVLAVVVGGGFASTEETEKGTRETIQAKVVNMSGAGPGTGSLTLWIESYTPDEAVARYVETFAEGGQDALVDLWQEERPVVGRLRFAGSLGYDLRLARARTFEGGRKLVLMTDRPIQGFELNRALRSRDYPVAWIEIDFVDGKDPEGRMIAAAQLSIEEGTLVIKSLGTQPARIVNVRVSRD